MSARDVLVTTLTNCLARTRVGRLEDMAAEAECLVNNALREKAQDIEAEIVKGIETLPERSDWFSGMFDARDIVRAETQK